MPDLVPQIECATRAAGEKIFHRQHMSVSKISHMDIVADRGSVRSVVICPENFQKRKQACGGGQHARQKMGFRLMIFSQLAIRVCASSIEVAQSRPGQSETVAIPVKKLFDDEFRFAVGIDRRLRMFFGDGYGYGKAIGGTA